MRAFVHMHEHLLGLGAVERDVEVEEAAVAGGQAPPRPWASPPLPSAPTAKYTTWCTRSAA
jgi:hypothetical protein